MRKKKGPCYHCGIDKTPLWRNGPPEKPVLCNACGSRYRLGKSLENYTPKTFQVLRKKKPKASKVKKAKSKVSVVPKAETVKIETTNGRSASTLLENYIPSESSTSHTQTNCVPIIKQENRDELPGENWGSLWETEIPSRKRSQVVYNNLSTIQKLQRDLQNILRDDGPNINNSSEDNPEEVLIYNVDINKLQIPSTEIGLGSILLKFNVTNSQDNQQETKPCSSNICDKVSHLDHDPMASPPKLANAWNDEEDGEKKNENSPINQLGR